MGVYVIANARGSFFHIPAIALHKIGDDGGLLPYLAFVGFDEVVGGVIFRKGIAAFLLAASSHEGDGCCQKEKASKGFQWVPRISAAWVRASCSNFSSTSAMAPL